MSNSMVVYFSASGVTKKVAKAIAKEKGSDILEIVPDVLYTKEDLDWTNMKSRSSVEMQDKSFRPKIKDINIDMSKYDIVYLGFPIWWYVAPTIVNTFLESNDFAGKKIVLFATAGSSDWGNTANELKPSVDETTEILTTKVLKSCHTDADIADFVKSL